MLRSLAIACAALVLAAPLAAQRRVVDSAATGTAALEGVVRDSAGKPVAGALIAVARPVRAILADSLGRFAVSNLPSDTIDVSVQHAGYAPAQFSLAIPPNTTVSVAVKMLASQSLAPVVISSQRRDAALTRRGFYERGRTGLGKFYDADALARRSADRLSVFLREVPSMRVSCNWSTGHECIVKDATGCAVPLWVDGVVHYDVDDYDEIIPYADVKAIEVYARDSQVPSDFATGRNRKCGAVVVWTRFAH